MSSSGDQDTARGTTDAAGDDPGEEPYPSWVSKIYQAYGLTDPNTTQPLSEPSSQYLENCAYYYALARWATVAPNPLRLVSGFSEWNKQAKSTIDNYKRRAGSQAPIPDDLLDQLYEVVQEDLDGLPSPMTRGWGVGFLKCSKFHLTGKMDDLDEMSKAQMNFVRVTGNNVCTALSYAIYKYASQHNTALFAPAVDEVVSICLGSRSLINKLVGEIGTTITHWSSAEGTDGGDFSQGGAGSDGVESSDRESGSESRAQRPADDQLGDR